jgi:putative nucleotidyltransferase with HDIG domain
MNFELIKKHKDILYKFGIYLYMIALTFIIISNASKAFNKLIWPNERYVVVIIASLFFLLFLYIISINNTKIIEIFFLYHIVLIGSILISFLPYQNRPYMLIPMLIALYYGIEKGIAASALILSAITFILGNDMEYFYATALISMISVLFAANIKNKLKSVIYGIIYIFLTFYINGIFQYYYTEKFDSDLALKSMVSVAISIIGIYLFVLIKEPFNIKKFIKKDSKPLLFIKQKSNPLYLHSVEVGDLAYNAAKKLNCNKDLALLGGLMHDIGKTTDNNYIKEGLKLANTYHLPKRVKEMIVEHNIKYRLPSSKESAIVMLSDSVVTSIEYVKSKDKFVSEQKVINNVFNVRVFDGSLLKSGLTLKEINIIKNEFIEFFNYGGNDSD